MIERATSTRLRSKAGHPPHGAAGGEVLLRMFFAAYGEKVVLVLGGYDKGHDSSPRRQAREIDQARKRLRSFKLRQERQTSGRRRRE
jgi:hypothetical protein